MSTTPNPNSNTYVEHRIGHIDLHGTADISVSVSGDTTEPDATVSIFIEDKRGRPKLEVHVQGWEEAVGVLEAWAELMRDASALARNLGGLDSE